MDEIWCGFHKKQIRKVFHKSFQQAVEKAVENWIMQEIIHGKTWEKPEKGRIYKQNCG